MKSDEQYDHSSFFFGFEFWLFWVKNAIFWRFLFYPTHFSAENRQTTKKFLSTMQHTQNPLQKNLGGRSTKIDKKNKN